MWFLYAMLPDLSQFASQSLLFEHGCIEKKQVIALCEYLPVRPLTGPMLVANVRCVLSAWVTLVMA